MYVVTGAAGQIGNVLVRELLSQGKKVRALIHRRNVRSLTDLEVEKYVGDVLDIDFLKKIFKNCEFVFHIAGLISIARGKQEWLYQTNVLGTKNVIRACLESGVRRLVFTGSIHSLHEPPPDTVIDENLPFDPEHTIGEYGRSKAQASIEILKNVKNGLDAVIVCPTAVVGPYDFRPSKLGRFLIDVLNKRLIAYIDGAYDFVDVRDVALGHILACDKGKTGENYILSGERLAIREMMRIIEEVTGVCGPKIKIPHYLAELVTLFTPLYYNIRNIEPRFTRYSIHTLLSNSYISNQKARDELGYRPRSLRESIKDAVDWFKENNILR